MALANMMAVAAAAGLALCAGSSKAQDVSPAWLKKPTAQDLLGFGVIDGIIPEPVGGAHRQPEAVMDSARTAIGEFLSSFAGNRGRLEIREHRREKYLAMGAQLG